jgi:succinoglycan biosynthesis transport protein ExoP
MSAADRAESKLVSSPEGRGRGHSLADDLAILRRRWRQIAGVVLATMLVFAVVHEHKAKSYTATASVTFQNSTLSGAALNIATAGSSEPQREADTEVLIAHSAEVARAVRGQLKLRSTTNELLAEVQVEAAPTADVLNVIATTADPQRSAALANAFAAQYIAFRTNAQLAGVAAAQTKIQEQIASLHVTTPEHATPAQAERATLEQTERATLKQTLVRLGSLRAVASGGANIIGSATAPTSPTGSGLSETLPIGLLVGLAIALSLVFLLESLDRRVKTIEEFEQGYRLPALVGIPRSRARTGQPETSELLEPYRILRSALDFTAVTHQLDLLMVTSAVLGEGKTTVAVNLARVVALSGRRTILVELDLRRPETVGPFELGAERGVTTAITGSAKLDELLVRPLADLPNLRVLPSGALPHNPSELLGSQRVTDLLSELASDGSMVIIDVPPLNPVADAQVLLNSPVINAAILVARIDRTTHEEIRLARSILDHHMVEPVGIVVTGVRETGGYGDGSYEAAGPTADVEIEAQPGRPGYILDEDLEARVVNLDSSTDAPASSRRSRPSPDASGESRRSGSSLRRTSN